MAKLILTLDSVVLKEYELTKERTTIGRKPHNDVQIDNLAVSGEHAAIVTILNDSFLEDLGSTNGTLVNGQSVKKHFLQNGDVIEIGKYKVKFVNDQASTTTAADFEKTMVLRTPPRPAGADGRMGDTLSGTGTTTELRRALTDTQPGPQGTLPRPIPSPLATNPGLAPRVSATAQGTQTALPGAGPSEASLPGSRPQPTESQGVIQILSGPNAGRELPLVKALTTLGRPGVQVAVITRRPQGFFITHVEGVQFPIVNGRTLDAQAHPLKDHDVLELAGVKMEFFLRPGA